MRRTRGEPHSRQVNVSTADAETALGPTFHHANQTFELRALYCFVSCVVQLEWDLWGSVYHLAHKLCLKILSVLQGDAWD